MSKTIEERLEELTAEINHRLKDVDFYDAEQARDQGNMMAYGLLQEPEWADVRAHYESIGLWDEMVEALAPKPPEVTRWKASEGQEMPDFVAENTGLFTAQDVVAAYGQHAVFEVGKPLPKKNPMPKKPKKRPMAKKPKKKSRSRSSRPTRRN